MFVYKSRFLTRGEVWFGEEPEHDPVDWIYHRQRSTPLDGARCKPFHTRLISLRKNDSGLLGAMEEKTVARINEALETDRLECVAYDASDPRVIDQVEAMWNRFADAHKTARLDRPWVDQISQEGALDLVAARSPAGMVLAYHLVFLTARRARQVLAVSPYEAVPTVAWRQAVSRANCLVHWHNFRRFRDLGIDDFDFGGWYTGTNDIRFLGINKFKQSFGGAVVREFDCEQIVTFKGRVLLGTARLLDAARRSPLLRRKEPRSVPDAPVHQGHKVSPAFR